MRARRATAGAFGARALVAAALGAVAALLVSCSGSGAGLIPAGNAGPLQSDFQAVANAAERGNGQCGETEQALSKTELDFSALPSSVSAELRDRLREGIKNLRTRALEVCKQPLPQATNTTPTTSTTTPTTTTTTSTSTPPPSTTTPTTTPPPTTTSASPGGGTPAEESKEQKRAEPGGEEPKAGGGGQEAGK